MQKVAVLGYGVEGKVAANYWAALGATITVCDANPDAHIPSDYQSKLGSDYLKGLAQFDLIIRTPSIRPDVILQASPGVEAKITSSVREFMRQCPAPVIGVTGTKGKGTTTTLIAEILKAAGKTVWVGGNIGRNPLEFLADIERDHYVVLELSSFQLIDLERSPQVAVCVMMAPEHLNWHPTMDEYVEAKANLFRYQSKNDRAVFKAGDEVSQRVAAVSAGTKVGYGRQPGAFIEDGDIVMDGTTVCATNEVGLIGPHNLENIMAAVTATWELVGRDAAPVRRAVKGFTGLEHRLELAGQVAGVRYYDDSFATTPETAIAAIKSFKEPKVIILGGSDKGAGYIELAHAVEDGGVIHAIVIGETAPAIEAALQKVGFTHLTTGLTTMKQVVETCYHITDPGDVVLLSPACASFDLFRDYKDRGNQFKQQVKDLATRTTK